MQVLELHCSVCKSSYYSKSEWLDHLLEESHQSLARLNLEEWGEIGRSHALVVFARLPTGKDDKLIQYLSRDFGTFVVDFVWWPERPRVAFVQFESKKKMKEVMGSLYNHQFKIDPDQFCEVKAGGSISELEWDGLLPETLPCQGDSRKTIPESHDPEAAALIQNSPNSPPPNSEASEPQSCPELSASGSPKLSNGLGLRHHLSSIRKIIEIPDEEYDAALDILNRVQGVLSNFQENPGRHPIYNYNAVISQHWNLKLRHYLTNRPHNHDDHVHLSIMIYKYCCSTECPNYTIPHIGVKSLENILNLFMVHKTRSAKQSFFTYETNWSSISKTSCGSCIQRYNIKLPNTGQQFNFRIVTNTASLGNEQVWRLTKYLCMFDPHCTAVLSLLHYWATKNSIAFGKLTSTYQDLGNSIGMNWLLIHYFQKQGLIPPTKLVLEQPHKSQLFRQVDIGFSDCPKFIISWKTESGRNTSEQNPDDEEFAKMVFKHLYKFFLYCGTTLKKGGWVVNTRDAELISIQKLLSSGQVKNSKLSESELSVVKSTIPKECREKMVMLNPFNINWRMSVSNAEEVFRAMNVTGKRLKTYLTKKSSVEMNLETFLQLLKV